MINRLRIIYKTIFALVWLGLAATTNTAGAQSLSQADRERIESYGASYCRAINSGDTESYSKAVREIFASSVLESIGEARLAAAS